MSSAHHQFRSLWAFLWHMIKPYKWLYAGMLMAPLLTAFYDVANNYALKMVVDAFSEPKEIARYDLVAPIVLFILANVFLDVIWRLSDVFQWRSEPFVRERIISHVYDYVQHNPYSFFQNTQSGTITSRIKGILDGYDNLWNALHHDLTARVASTFVLTAALLLVNVRVCLLVSIWAIIVFIVMYFFSKKLDQLSFINANHRHEILGSIADNISNIFTIFSFSARKTEFNALKNSVHQKFIPSNIKVYKFSFLSNIVAGLFYWVMLFSLFLYMIYLREQKLVSTGDLVFVMTTTLKMSWELWQIIQRMQNFMKNIGDLRSSFAIIKTPHKQEEMITKEMPLIITPTITFNDVDFSYGDKTIFEKLNFHIKAGEKIGLVGLSGAGKSSIVSLILRYFIVNNGKISLGGNDISKFSPDSVRNNTALIPQDIMLFHRTIFDNIRYGKMDASKDEVIRAANMANIHDFIMELPDGYDSLVGERGIKLSGGQRQRIAIARALLKNAPILILDEATASLDTETEQLIQSSLNRLLENSATTVIAIAHRLSTIRHMDRILVLERGKIIEQGTHDDLLRHHEVYKRLWQLQQM